MGTSGEQNSVATSADIGNLDRAAFFAHIRTKLVKPKGDFGWLLGLIGVFLGLAGLILGLSDDAKQSLASLHGWAWASLLCIALMFLLVVYWWTYSEWLDHRVEIFTLQALAIDRPISISNKLAIIERLVRKGTVAMTATCLPFELVREGDGTSISTVSLYLINNPNYRSATQPKYWLPPGGHVNLHLDDAKRESALPAAVARKKCASEACLEVQLLSNRPEAYQTHDEAEFQVLPRADLCFLLGVDKVAKCNASDGHELHIDLCYIGLVQRKTIATADSFERQQIDFNSKELLNVLNLSQTGQVSASRNPLLQLVETKLKSALPTNAGHPLPYPADLPDRICLAIKLLHDGSCLGQ